MKSSASKLRIGINVENKPSYNGVPEFHYIEAGYVDAIVRAGAVPVILAPVDDVELIPSMLDSVDAVMLVGGPDLDPRNDGYMLHPSVRAMSPRREKFDRALIAEAERRRMPVMGIGVGMQLINVSQGGALFLHIPEDNPDALPHRDANLNPSLPPLRHELVVEKGSLLSEVYGENDVRVNSRHHMAVDEVAPGFAVTARCQGDGTIEAIESTREDWFAFGVQFHPEARSATFLDRRIFDVFVDGVQSFVETGVNRYAMKPRAHEIERKGTGSHTDLIRKFLATPKEERQNS